MKQGDYTRPCDREDVAFKATEIHQVDRTKTRGGSSVTNQGPRQSMGLPQPR